AVPRPWGTDWTGTRPAGRRGAAGPLGQADPHGNLHRPDDAAAVATSHVQPAASRGSGQRAVRAAHVSGRDWIAMEEWSPEDVDGLLTLAARIKRGEITGGLERKVLAMVFLDPSLRTRASMETAMFLHGGHAL